MFSLVESSIGKGQIRKEEIVDVALGMGEGVGERGGIVLKDFQVRTVGKLEDSA